MLDKRGLWATVLVASLALACDGGSSTPDKDSKAADGGGKGGSKGSGDKGSSGKDGGANADGGGNSGGNTDAGQDAGVDQGPNNTGDLSSIWKRYSSEITIIDSADPPSVVQKTIDLPPTVAMPVDDREVDLYQQIKDNTLLTYAHLDGDQVYYQLSSPPLTGSDTVYVGADDSGQYVLELTDGHLVETRGHVFGDLTVSTRATYSAYTGKFPPADWPTEKLVLP